MATSFAQIRQLQRALLGDADFRAYRFSDDILDAHTRLAITILDEPGIVEDSDSGEFSEDLSNKNKMRVAIRSALSIIAPMDNEFSHRSPVFAVSRKGGVKALTSTLKELLLEIESGGTRFAVSVDYSIDALVNELHRRLDSITQALARS